MAEYIEREKAMERIQPHIVPKTMYGEGYMRAIEHATTILQVIPPADVQPVRRGKWTITDDVEHFIAICSECGRTEDSRDIKDMPYCHCGAKMKQED